MAIRSKMGERNNLQIESLVKDVPKKNVAIIVQARMGASRLPSKPLLKVLNKPLLKYLIDRIKASKLADTLVIATTNKPQDDPIANLAKSENVLVVRGDEEDVLSRFVLACQTVNADIIVRITADCPLMDPKLIDIAIAEFLKNDVDYLSNTLKRTFPRGFDIEIFTKEALFKTSKLALKAQEKEHVTLFIYQHRELFKLINLKKEGEREDLRLTVDTKEDFELIAKVLEELFPKNPLFTYQDVIELLKRHPEWEKINCHIKQKSV